MSTDIALTVVGNLTADPELRYLATGVPVTTFAVASTPRVFDRDTSMWRDGEPTFLRCQVWRDQAENLAQSLSKGARVIVQGRLRQRSYETAEGDKRTVELDVDEVGAALRFATATATVTVRRASRGPRLVEHPGDDTADDDAGTAAPVAAAAGER